MSKKKSRLPPMTEMLLAEDKWISRPTGPKGILVRLWRRVLMNMNVTPIEYQRMMNEFVVDATRDTPTTPKLQTVLRGNLNKEFIRNRMTWPVFLKGLRFVRYRKIRFIVIGFRENGQVDEHFTDVDLGSRNDLGQFLRDVAAEDDEDEQQSSEQSENKEE